MSESMFMLVRIIVCILASLIGYAIKRYLIPILRRYRVQLEQAELWDEIEKAVRAAEQTFKGEGGGAAKKQKVLNYMLEYLEKNGIKITEKQLDQLIEAAVFNMNTEGILYTATIESK